MPSTTQKRGLFIAVTAVLLAVPLGAQALQTRPPLPVASGETNQMRLNNLKTRGDSEIGRRLGVLTKLSSVINGALKLSPADKANLTSQVNGEIAGLTALKLKLSGETELAAARTDVKSIVSDYRVYVLIGPKVYLMRAADTISANDDKLMAFSVKLQERLDTLKTAGKDVSALQTSLNDMVAKINAAKTLAAAVSQKVFALQPTDYNSDHTILIGLRDQLKTAHLDNIAAYNDAKTIFNTLRRL